jgi:glutamate dehydrogenase/leucine dehydrogenase
VKLLDEDTDGILQGFELGMVTGKPVRKGGSLGRTKATGLGGFLALKAILKHFAPADYNFDKDVVGRKLNNDARALLKKNLNQMTAAIQGSGNVGEYHAWELHRAGVKILILEDAAIEGREYVKYTLHNPKGINVELLNQNLERLPDGRWAPLKTLTKEFFEKTGCVLFLDNSYQYKSSRSYRKRRNFRQRKCRKL